MGSDALKDLSEDESLGDVVDYSDGRRSSLELGLSPGHSLPFDGEQNDEGDMEDGEIVNEERE